MQQIILIEGNQGNKPKVNELTDCVSWALVQHMKNLSLLLQLLAWPSSNLCLMWRKKSCYAKKTERNLFVLVFSYYYFMHFKNKKTKFEA